MRMGSAVPVIQQTKPRMTLFFPEINVWLALCDAGHPHNTTAWNWLGNLAADEHLVLSRFTQLGILRLLTNRAAMGDKTLTLGEAWDVYERWLEDSRVEFLPEPRQIDAEFRKATKPFSAMQATKWVPDCWLLAFAEAAQARLVTFDRALFEFALKRRHSAVIPA